MGIVEEQSSFLLGVFEKAIATALKATESGARGAVHRLRKRFRELFRSQMETGPFSKFLGLTPKVYGNVPDMSGDHAHKFPLRFTELVVKSAKDAPARKGLILLNEVRRKSCGRIVARLKCLGEPTALISMLLELNELHITELRVDNFHCLIRQIVIAREL